MDLPRPTARDLAEFRILTLVELAAARDGIQDLAEEGTLDQQAIAKRVRAADGGRPTP